MTPSGRRWLACGVAPTRTRIAAGRVPRGITLREALDLHLAAKPLSPRTKDDYRYNCEQYLSDWLGRPLAELGTDRSGVRDRHRRITEQHGAPSADNAFRIFRAVYNRGLREHPDLPPNPCGNVDYRAARWMPRRTGSRRGARRCSASTRCSATCTCSWYSRACGSRLPASELDLASGRLHVPKPKCGSTRAFDLPLSGPLADLFGHRVGENPRLHRKTP